MNYCAGINWFMQCKTHMGRSSTLLTQILFVLYSIKDRQCMFIVTLWRFRVTVLQWKHNSALMCVYVCVYLWLSSLWIEDVKAVPYCSVAIFEWRKSLKSLRSPNGIITETAFSIPYVFRCSFPEYQPLKNCETHNTAAHSGTLLCYA